MYDFICEIAYKKTQNLRSKNLVKRGLTLQSSILLQTQNLRIQLMKKMEKMTSFVCILSIFLYTHGMFILHSTILQVNSFFECFLHVFNVYNRTLVVFYFISFENIVIFLVFYKKKSLLRLGYSTWVLSLKINIKEPIFLVRDAHGLWFSATLKYIRPSASWLCTYLTSTTKLDPVIICLWKECSRISAFFLNLRWL